MDGAGLLFSLLVCVCSLLGCVLVGAGRGDEQSTITAQEQEHLPHPHPQPDAITPPYLVLPMFQHQSTPAVAKELLNPVAGSHVLPSTLSNILIPQGLEPYIRVTPVNNNHGVEVWCGYSKITVRIDQALLNFRSFADHFRLGTCAASRAEGRVLYFQYELSACGSVLSVMKGKLLYANEVLYRPESQGAVLRAVPLTLPVQCVYDRFHYSYKIGFLPEFHPRWFRKTMVRKQVFSLSVCDDQWQELGLNGSYVIGEPAYFEVSAETISKDMSVYVEACHVTASEDPNSTQRYDIISNFGCMVDSKRTGSRSRFVSRKMNVLRFSLDAFAFSEATSARFYLHCTVRVGSVMTSSTAKSCTYNESERRWAELSGHASICSCCDSVCRAPDVSESSSLQMAVVSSKPWSLIQNNVFPGASEELNMMLSSVQLHHLHYQEGEGSQGEEAESDEKEESCAKELVEEVVIGVSERDDLMSDEGLEEGDSVKVEEDEENKQEDGADEGQKNATDSAVKLPEKTWQDEEMLERS